VPGNIKWRTRQGRVVEVPIIGFIGFLGVASIFVTVIATHEIGRIAGPAWILLCVGYYFYFRHHNGLPLLGNVHHDWEKEQIEVLTAAGETELLEQYKVALEKRDKALSAAGSKGAGNASH
jgi:APA family basic amino acid/polyamine antiporter